MSHHPCLNRAQQSSSILDRFSQPSRSATTATPGDAGWKGNLPCLRGPDRACHSHNPTGYRTFYFDSALSRKRTSSFTALLRTLAGVQDGEDPDGPSPIVSTLPRTPETLDPLAPLHPSIPYRLCFYHVAAVFAAYRSSSPSSPSSTVNQVLAGLTCAGKTPASLLGPSHVRWTCTPRLEEENPSLLLLLPFSGTRGGGAGDGGSSSSSGGGGLLFYLEQTATFSIPLDIAPGKGGIVCQSRSEGLFSPAWRSFQLCPHLRREFTGVHMRQRRERVSAAVRFRLRSSVAAGQAFDGDWRSEVGAQPEDVSCGRCAMDGRMTLELAWDRRAVVVRMWTWRDLGRGGRGRADGKWVSALRGGADLRRPREDFGRVRRAFIGDDPVSETGLVQLLGKVGESVFVGETESVDCEKKMDEAPRLSLNL